MIVDTVLDIINKFIPDKTEAAKAAVLLESEYTKQMEVQSEVIKKEMSCGGLSAKWRPITAIIFVAMLVTHYVMYDIIPFVVVTFNLDLYCPQDPGYTDGLLEVVKFCLGGYIFSRSVEKGVKFWRK